MPHDSARPQIGEGNSAIQPVVMNCSYQLPWDRKSSQTACGETIQQQNGDMGWRVTVEGILTYEQLVALNGMREQERVILITEEFGKMSVAFDNLQIDRAGDEAYGEIEGNESILVSFQLQTKESDEEGEGIEFFNENTRGSQNG